MEAIDHSGSSSTGLLPDRCPTRTARAYGPIGLRAGPPDTTLQGYRSNIENHIIPALGNRKVGELTVAELDRFANAKLKEGLAPSTVNRFRETLRSTVATQLAEAGVHPRKAQAFLGHADMTTTMKYYVPRVLRQTGENRLVCC